MTSEPLTDVVDLSNCDREPIHIPGSILPHGAMLVVDPASFAIVQVAGDTGNLLGVETAALIGAPLSRLLSAEQIARLRSLTGSSPLSRPRHMLDPLLRVVPARPIDASVHVSDGALVIEVEDADLGDRHVMDPLACVQDMVAALGDAADLQSYCQKAAQQVRSVCGYDRVMIYRFMADDSGWVFAEACSDELPPFLDLHYPASDIPKQARALYVTSWLRLITEVEYAPAPLLPRLNPMNGRPLDMSHATLRDVSPIHREYLRNMGVDASMSISIIHEGKLWGLIACHHSTPRRLPRHLRAVCEIFGSMFSLQLEARLRAEQLESRLKSRKALSAILQALARQDDYAVGLMAEAGHIIDYIAAGGLALRVGQSGGGVAVRVNDGITSVGQTPSDDQIGALTDWLTGYMQDFEGIFATDRLGEIWPAAREFADVASGLLAVSVSREPRDFVLWFRPEVVETVTWGGDPRKPVETGPNGDRLTPRKSFEAWTETVRGRSSPWLDSENDAAFDLRVALLEIVLRRIDAAARERLRAWEQEQLLMAELDHRVKNTLANIQALVSQTSRNAESVIDFTDGLNRRIHSMSRAHSLLTKSRWEGVSIDSVAHEELDAYRVQAGHIVIEGPAVMLTPKAGLALSLGIHELATNAAKYGALSVPTGRVEVIWNFGHAEGVTLTWTEKDGPRVMPPKTRGFGSTLIQRALALETGGTSSLAFEPGGVVCSITLPAEALHLEGTAAPHADSAAPAPASSPARRPTLGHRILVVEDSALVVLVIEDILRKLGLTIVGPGSRLAEALKLAREETIHAALLDVNLNGEMSWEVAAVLRDRGIPFLFTTGYDAGTMLPTAFADEPVLNKPFKSDDLANALMAMLEL